MFFAGSIAGASMVSFYVVETGLSDEAERRTHSDQWENAFLDVFFEAGHIVSNAPILRLEIKPANDILQSVAFDIFDARMGGIEFILIAILDYVPDKMSADEISFYIYNVNTKELLFEKHIQGKIYRTSREELDDLKAIARGLVPYIGE